MKQTRGYLLLICIVSAMGGTLFLEEAQAERDHDAAEDHVERQMRDRACDLQDRRALRHQPDEDVHRGDADRG